MKNIGVNFMQSTIALIFFARGRQPCLHGKTFAHAAGGRHGDGNAVEAKRVKDCLARLDQTAEY
jgi:hypothetical protein